MNRSVLMIMGGALLVAIVVAVLVQAKLRPKDKIDMSNQILVTRKAINTGEILKPEDVDWQPWPASAMFDGVIKREDYPDDKQPEVYNTPLRRSLKEREPVTKQALIADIKGGTGGSTFLAASISPGMRAATIGVNAVKSVAGFVQPGDYVDVLVTHKVELPSEVSRFGESVVGRYASQTLLSNVKVLAVDQTYKTDKPEPKVRKTVTLEVTREGAETLALGEHLGALSLVLRRIGEKDTPETAQTPVTTEASTSEVSRRMNEILRTTGPSATVRVYSGTEIQDVPVRRDGQ